MKLSNGVNLFNYRRRSNIGWSGYLTSKELRYHCSLVRALDVYVPSTVFTGAWRSVFLYRFFCYLIVYKTPQIAAYAAICGVGVFAEIDYNFLFSFLVSVIIRL